MVAKGLPDATQRILADASKYIEEFDKINRKNLEIRRGNKELEDSFNRLEASIGKIERSIQRVADQYAKMERQKEYIKSFNDMQAAVDAAHEANERFNANPVEIEDHTHLIEEATKAYRDHTGATEVMRQATIRYLEEADRADTTHQMIIDSSKTVKAVQEEQARVAKDLAAAQREVNAEFERTSSIADRVAGAGNYLGGPSYARPDTFSWRNAASLPSYGSGDTSRIYGGGAMTALASLLGAHGHPAASIALGAAGLMGIPQVRNAVGAGMGAIGGAVTSGPGAFEHSQAIVNFVRRWYGPAHWAMMLTNELLATVGPAAVAGGMGALTGVQGFEQLIPRGKAVFSTSESLGDSLGMTTGKFWGLKHAYLQNAQDLATGMATEMAGAMVNIINSPGTGTTFTQLGLSTDAMMSRFMANLTMHFQKGGLGGKLGNIVTGGTGYLQQFGDVLANLGNTFVNLAPNLPGVGGDLLGTLTGVTGGLSHLTGWLGGAAGPLLGAEAGFRWGPGLVGLASRGIGQLGRIPGLGFLGDAAAGTGLAGLLGGITAPELAIAGASAFMLNKAYTYQSPHNVAVNQALANIGQMGFVPGFGASIQEMQNLSQLRPGNGRDLVAASMFGNIGGGLKELYSGVNAWSPSEAFHGITRAGHGILQMAYSAVTGKPTFDTTPYEKNQQAIQSLADTMVNALNAGGQIQDQWKALSGHAISMGKATDVATMAQLQLGNAFQKNGMLSDQAKTMIANLYAGYAPMHMNAGMFGSAVGAQTAMAGLQHTQVAAVNQAYDQLSQLVTGGAASSAGFFGLLGGTPTTLRRGGIQFATAPGLSGLASALGSFTTPTGAAAWNRLTNQQTGLFPAMQGNLDWLRNAQVMGALGPGQTTGMASYEMAQLLPSLKGNPAALSMLSMYAQQFGGPGFAPGTSAGTMFRSLSHFFARTGVSNRGYNQLMTLGTEGMANIGTDANQFVQNIGSGIGGAMSTAVFSRGEDLMKAFMQAAGHKGSTAALGNLANFMAGSGTPLAGAQEMVKYSAKLSGASPASIASMLGQLKKDYEIYVKVHADTGGASKVQSALSKLQNKIVTAQAKAQGSTEVRQLQQAIDFLKNKTVQAIARAQGAGAVAALNAEIAALHDKVVTITIRTINQTILQTITTPGGVASGTLAGGPAGMRLTNPAGHAAGFKVPGYGGGDIHPAMLEGGEAVVPKHLVPSIAPFLAAHGVPGFAAGGFVGQSPFGAGQYWGLGNSLARWNPAYYALLMQNMRATQGTPYISGPVHPGGGFSGGIHALVAAAATSAGVSGANAATLAQVNAQIKDVWKILDQLYARKDRGDKSVLPEISRIWKTKLDPLYAEKDRLMGKTGSGGSSSGMSAAELARIAKDFTVHLTGQIAKEVKNSSEASKIATELVNKIATEMHYAYGVANAAAYGQGYDPSGKGSGIFGSMQVNPSGLTQAQLHSSPTGNIKDYNAYVAAYAADTVGSGGTQSVQDQMKSYLSTEQSFGKDIGKLRKAHLNKAVLSQLIAAGPQQGDALAQSILGGHGGVKAVNKLWNQIQKASKGLGAQAAMGMYGGTVAPNLKSGGATVNNISISVSAGGGGATMDLSDKQIAAIVAKVQAALLKQAKKNRKTGVKLPGKSA